MAEDDAKRTRIRQQIDADRRQIVREENMAGKVQEIRAANDRAVQEKVIFIFHFLFHFFISFLY
jgi:hypothetical protein